MKITYVFEATPLFGGNKVPLHQANLLARRGHQVTVVSGGPPPDWYPLTARFIELAPPIAAAPPTALPPSDVTVATFWTTIAPVAAGVAAAGRGEAVHFCQGFEASYTHNQDEHAAILAAYERPLPAIAVAPHLATLIEQRFGRPARVVPQPLEPFWRPDGSRTEPGNPARILVPSPFEIDWKGVATALEAVRILRAGGVGCRLVRLSQWPLSDAERAVLPPDEFHCHLLPEEVAALVASCDLLLAPSWAQEGFGLPALEALACGVPVVASDIPCYRGFAAPAATLVRHDQPAAFAAAAAALLADAAAWRRSRAAGLTVAMGYAEERAADAAEAALHWVASGRWRAEAEALRQPALALAGQDRAEA